MSLKLWGKVFGFCGIFVLLAFIVVLALPGFMKARIQPSGHACCENLQKIDGAKQQWALERNKKDTDIPTWADLVGPDTYLRKTPTCPEGGVYAIGAVNQDPACSLAPPPRNKWWQKWIDSHPGVLGYIPDFWAEKLKPFRNHVLP
jgi:hypothetical protein